MYFSFRRNHITGLSQSINITLNEETQHLYDTS